MGEAARGAMVVERDLRAVAKARRFVRPALGRWEVEEDHGPCPVAGEPVTNAIRYGGTADDEVVLRLVREDDGLLSVEVQDATWEFPRMRIAGLTGEPGRGLFVVEAFSRYPGCAAPGG